MPAQLTSISRKGVARLLARTWFAELDHHGAPPWHPIVSGVPLRLLEMNIECGIPIAACH
jgi:hypothetical protein